MNDDLSLVAIGRQFVEFSVRQEQLIRQVQSLQAELERLKAKPPE